jgi:rhodanese-related sulfurtransferase
MKHSPAFLALVDDAKNRVREITPDEVRGKLAEGVQFHLVDVREDREWDNGHIRGAIHLSRGILERDVETMIPDRDAEIVLYCGGGYRSALSGDNLQKMGYANVKSMAGGWREWIDRKYEIEEPRKC